MSSFLDSCEQYFETRDLYTLLGIEKTATDPEVKRAYKKLSLSVHPDRVQVDKDIATEKFKILGKVYTLLSDSEKRAVYDETGCVDGEDDLQVKDWYNFWRGVFKEITEEDIDDYEEKYKDSVEESIDLAKAYKAGKGCMDYIFNYVPFTSPKEETRIRSILQTMIDNKELSPYTSFTNEKPSKRLARQQKYEKEMKQAQREKVVFLKNKRAKTMKAETDGKQAEGALAEVGLVEAIRQRSAKREADSKEFLSYLENKFCKGKEKSSRKKTNKTT